MFGGASGGGDGAYLAGAADVSAGTMAPAVAVFDSLPALAAGAYDPAAAAGAGVAAAAAAASSSLSLVDGAPTVASNIFGLLVAGRPVVTDFVALSDDKYLVQVPAPGLVTDIALFLLPGNEFPADRGVTVMWAAPPFTEWATLGTLSAEVPSAVFRTGWSTSREVAAVDAVQIGLSVDPIDSVRNTSQALSSAEADRLAFVQLVGLTGDEYDAIRDWDSAKMTALMQEKDKALLTDLVRESTLKDKVFAKKVKEGVEKEGSSMAAVFSTKGEIDAEKRIFGVAANSLEDLGRLLRGRLPFGRDATLIWPGGSATIVAGDETKIDDDTLTLSEADRKAILEIPVKRGDYPLPSGKVTLQVIPIKILDGKRKKVERTVG